MPLHIFAKAEKLPTPLVIGLALTGLWLTLAFAFLWWKWGVVVDLTPPNAGDTLAGMFAPLAFLWLTIAVLLQQKELNANTSALLLQREELCLIREENGLARKVFESQLLEMKETGDQNRRQADALNDNLELSLNNARYIVFTELLFSFALFLHQNAVNFRVIVHKERSGVEVIGLFADHHYGSTINRDNYESIFYTLGNLATSANDRILEGLKSEGRKTKYLYIDKIFTQYNDIYRELMSLTHRNSANALKAQVYMLDQLDREIRQFMKQIEHVPT